MRNTRTTSVAFALGAFLVMAGVLAIRCASALKHWVPGSSLLRHLLFFHPSTSLILRSLPETFLFGLCLIAAGCVVLFVSTQAVAISPTVSEAATGSPARAREITVLAVAPSLVIGLCALAKWTGRLNTAWSALAFGASLTVVMSFWAARDRRSGVRLGFQLSRGEGAGILVGCAVLLGLYARGFDSWKFSFIGDEWAFYERAKSMVSHPNAWLNVGSVEDFPLTLSTWQSLPMRLLGVSNASWRFSMALLMAACIPPLYFTLRHLLSKVSFAPRRAAAFGCASFALAEAIVDWARIGKPHASFVPPLVFGGCFLLAARARHSWFYYSLAGITCGLGCLLSSLGAAVAAFTLGGLLLIDAAADLLAWRARNRRSLSGEPWPLQNLLLPAVLFIAGFLIGIAPVLVQLDFWKQQIGRNLVSEEARANRGLLVTRTVQAFFSFLDYHGNLQFLYGNMVDPITAFFSAAAFGMVRFTGLRTWVKLIWTLFAVGLVTGGISQYGYPPPTRVFVIMVPVALLAAVGFAGLMRSSRRTSAVLVLLLIPLCAAYNILKLETWNPYQTNRDMRQIEMQRIQESPTDRLHALVTTDREGLLSDMVEAYGYSHRVFFFEDTREELGRLAAFLRRNAARTEVQAERGVPDIIEIRTITEKAGARFGPLMSPGVPIRPKGDKQWILRLFDTLNP